MTRTRFFFWLGLVDSDSGFKVMTRTRTRVFRLWLGLRFWGNDSDSDSDTAMIETALIFCVYTCVTLCTYPTIVSLWFHNISLIFCTDFFYSKDASFPVWSLQMKWPLWPVMYKQIGTIFFELFSWLTTTWNYFCMTFDWSVAILSINWYTLSTPSLVHSESFSIKMRMLIKNRCTYFYEFWYGALISVFNYSLLEIMPILARRRDGFAHRKTHPKSLMQALV